MADLMRDLIERLDANLDANLAGDAAVPPNVLALRRALRGKHGPQDEAALAGHAQGGRICLVTASPERLPAVRRELEATSSIVVDTWGDGLLALVPGLPRDADAGVRGRVTRWSARVQRVAAAAAVGVSTPLEHLGQVPRALDEATRALAACGPGATVFADDAWFAIAISRLRDSIRESLVVDGPLDRLDEGPDLRATVATWLAQDGDARAAAAELHLHPNTLRYRLRRAAQVTGIDFDDPLQRLVVHLALTAGHDGL